MLSWCATVAGAMALLWSVLALPVTAAPTTGPGDIARSQMTPSQVPSFDEIDPLHQSPQQVPAFDAQAATTPPTTTAPLPTALLAGSATMALAGWFSWRIRRRGGRI